MRGIKRRPAATANELNNMFFILPPLPALRWPIVDPPVEIANELASIKRVGRNGYYEVRLANQRFAILAQLILGCRDGPYVEIVIGTVVGGREETRWAQLTDEIRTASGGRVEHLQRPDNV